ncbi:hypothetical protein [Prosthecobacter sp.]|jgi:hypothetical protein|uniref:hypothetical protein n=1 Tax=Prosthecobacter sp. TaxID=1965333 RepID=UPI0037CA7DD4
MKGCFKFVVILAVLIIGASFARYHLMLTPTQRQAEREHAALVGKEETLAAEDAAKTAEAQLAVKAEKNKDDQERVNALKPEFITWLQRNAGAETARFNGDVLEVKFTQAWASKDEARVKAESLAHAWRLRSGLTEAECAIYWGNEIYAKGADSGPVPEIYLARVMAETIQKQQDKDAAALVAMKGKTFAEIEGTHGAAITKSKETGWAEFQTFRARFENGKVAEVSVK